MSEDDTRRMPTLEKTGAAPDPAPEPGDDPYGPYADHTPVQTGRPDGGGGRFWSVRRLPALLVGVPLLAGSVLLLYDVAVVRSGRTGGAWRRSLAQELAERRLDDALVLTGASLAVLLGLWLLVLALTPGLRGLLTMAGEPGLRAGLERRAAALLLRDRAVQVPGVRTVEVRVTRRRVRAKAVSHFRELDAVRADLVSELTDGVRQLGLARELRLDVSVRRPAKQ